MSSTQKVKRNVLLNPGPATTTDTVKFAQVVPDICPREKEFTGVMKQVSEGLVKIAHGNVENHTCVLFCGSGTLVDDVCLNSLLPKDTKALVIDNGTYSDRAVDILTYYGLPFEVLKFPVTELADPKKVEEVLQKNKENKNETQFGYVYMTHQETGVGILNPLKEIGAVAHKYNLPLIADTISTFAMIPLDIEKDNVDVITGSAQKGIMAMSGLSFVIAKKSLIEASKDFPKRSYYNNLYRQYKYFITTGQMNFTPPVQTIYAARQGIQEYFQEGELKKYERHMKVMEEIHKGEDEIGFKELIPRSIQSGLVSALIYPDDDPNWDFQKVHDYCYERGFTLYPGISKNVSTFRICSLGAIYPDDIKEFWKVFKEGLKVLGISVPLKYKQ